MVHFMACQLLLNVQTSSRIINDMHKRLVFAIVRIGFALLGISALVAQLMHGMQQPTFGLVNFFSFFTIESNILGAIVLLTAGIAGLFGRRAFSDFTRGAATVYMATTGVVYALLLSGLENSLQTPIPWVNIVLHYIMPVVICADWLIDRAKTITPRKAAWWLVFPLAYVAYSLMRGHIKGWYPYPFLNPTKHGYVFVAEMSVIIAVGIVAIIALVAWYGRAPKTK